MPYQAVKDFDQNQLSRVLDKIPIAVTVFDLEGRLLYFNDYSQKIIDRKSEYLGRDIRLCHKKPESNAKIDSMIQEFKNGRRQDFYYEAAPYGRRIAVTVSPLEVDGRLMGCIQTVALKENH